jgi:hypothetical protein
MVSTMQQQKQQQQQQQQHHHQKQQQTAMPMAGAQLMLNWPTCHTY